MLSSRGTAGNELYEFGPYRIDVALSRLERAGEAIPLPPKAFDLLLLLALNHERVVSKAELMSSLWPETFVDEANLTQHVYTLRKTLGSRGDGRPFIETIARRGYRLAVAVRNVGASTLPGAPTAPAVPVVFEGERKHATVVHCALANAAAVTERIGSAGLHRAMRDLMAIATEHIERYEGAITERHTDGFIAVFGAALVHEDDADRGVLAALAIGRGMRELNVPAGSEDERVAIQIAVHTGPVIVTRVAGERRAEYSAVGEAIRTAASLQQRTESDAVLVSDATRAALRGELQIDAVVDTPAGGRAYQVGGVRRQAGGAAPLTRRRSPLVGRQDELALLESILTRARAGAGQALSIVAEPGMGKSRLVAEFTRDRDRGDTLEVVEGRCVSYGSTVPYLPLVDVARALCGVRESDPPDVIRHAVDSAVRADAVPEESAVWLLQLLGAADDCGDAAHRASPEAVKSRTFDALRHLLLRAARRRPLVLIIEDVHWIDRSSEEFLTTLVDHVFGARVLLVVTHRPGYRAPWLDKSFVTQITLSPLNAADSARLVAAVAGESAIDAGESIAILNRGEGNPFFLEELTRATLDRGSDIQRPIPATVHGVIMARIDRLPDAAKLLLQTASVVGREVPLDVLTRVWRGALPFDDELKVLRRLEFLFERPSGEPSYVFKHALTQDVAYDSLLARTRRELHLRVAQALESRSADRADEIAATLAYHYVRTDLAHDAVKWLVRAAERAARVYANDEAIAHLDLAARRLQRWPEDADRDRWIVRVALQQAHSLYFLGRFHDSVDVLLPHDARLARLDDPAAGAAYAFWLAHMYSRLGDQRRARENAARAIELSTRVGDQATLGKTHGLLALESYWSGRPVEGVVEGRTAIGLLDRQRDQLWWLGMAHFYLALNHLLAGDFGDALVESGWTHSIGVGLGDPRLQTYAAYIVGWAEACRGRHDVAIAACRRGLELAPDRVSRVYASLFLAMALVEQGNYADALPLIEPVAAELEEIAIPQWHALARALAADSLRALGRIDEASAAIDSGLAVATRAGYIYAVGYGTRVAGRLARDRGALSDAAVLLDRALETFTRIGAAFEVERTRAEIARFEKSS